MWRRLLIWVVALLVLALIVFILVQLACDQSYPYTWDARYNSEPNGDEEATAMAVSGDGSIYVAGFTLAANGDFLTLKYDSDGELIWEARYDGPAHDHDKARAIATDGEGNVFVAGYSQGNGTSKDLALVKFSSDGEELWAVTYDGPVHGEDSASAVCTDGNGNVYVCGHSVGRGADYIVLKYDGGGNMLWEVRYDGPKGTGDIAYAMVLDKDGNVYVTGESSGAGTFTDFATIKYDTDGNQLWAARYDGPMSLNDEATDLTVDASGNVYVTGQTSLGGHGANTTTELAIVSYSAAGDQRWAVHYNVPEGGRARANAITLDPSGYVYVAGSATFTVRDYTQSDAITIKYSTDGDEAWVARYDSPVRMNDGANDVVVDSAGNVYAAGSSVEIGSYNDYMLLKYDSEGTLLWFSRYNGPAGLADVAIDAAIDSDDDVYVTGYSYAVDGDAEHTDIATLKYTP